MQTSPLIFRRVAQAAALHHSLTPLQGPLDKALANHFRQHKKFGSQDRAWLRNLLFAYWRWFGWVQRQPLERGLLLGYLLDGHQIGPEVHAWAVREGLSLADLQGCECPDSFTFTKKLSWIQGLGIAVTAQEVNPLWLPDWGGEQIAVQQEQAPLWLRLQGANPGQLLAELAQQSAQGWLHPQLATACRVAGRVNLEQLSSYRLGLVEVQDLHSQMVGLACNPQPGETWIDLCAGAGGKALQLASLQQGQGQVIGLDIRPAPLEEAASRRRRSGMRNLSFALWDGQTLPKLPACRGVLVDAPCSGSGTWRRAPDLRWRFQPSQLPELAATQTRLLELGSSLVEPGGRLVYATCSLLAEENQIVVQGFLARHPEFHLQPPHLPLASEASAPGLTFWPPGGDGIYLAVMARA